MKKVLLFLVSCCMAMGAMAQFVINAWGNIEFTPSTTNAWTNHFVTYAGNAYAKNYVVSWDGTHRFWVLGNGNVFASNSITTSGIVTVKNTDSVVFEARNLVILDKNFTVDLGGTFEVNMDGCFEN